MKRIKASIIGFGSVGQGVARVLLRKKEELSSIGLDIVVVAVADSKTAVIDEEGVDLTMVLERKASEGIVGDEHIAGHDIIRDIEHDLVIETTPTNIDTGTCLLLSIKGGMLSHPTKVLLP